MNINAQFRRIWNVIKHESQKWDTQLEKEHAEGGITSQTGYMAAYFGGARDIGAVLLSTYGGENSDQDIENAILTWKNPSMTTDMRVN